MKLIKSMPLTQNFASISLPAGKYKGFFINFTGVAQAGQTLLNTTLGSVRMLVKGRQYQLIEIDRLQDINNLKHGAPARTSGAGAAFNFTAWLPAGVPGDNVNVLFVEQDGEIVMELNGFYGATVVVILSGNVTVYGIEAEGIHKYFLNISQIDFNTVLGNGSQNLQGIENFYELFLAYSANLASLSVLIDGKSRYSDASLLAMIDMTNLFNAVETYTATPPLLDLPLSGTGDLSEALGDTCVLNYRVTTAAIAPLEVTVFSIDLDPVKETASSLVLQNVLAGKLGSKQLMGKTRAVQSMSRG